MTDPRTDLEEPPMLTFVVLVAVAMHAVGHILFFGPTVGVAGWGSGNSWLLTGLIGDVPARAIGGVIWAAAGVLFLAGIAGFVREADWWRAATIAAAVISLVGTVAYVDGIKQPSGLAALIFNVVVLGALLVARWPATAGLNS
jgi:hypothetical protein